MPQDDPVAIAEFLDHFSFWISGVVKSHHGIRTLRTDEMEV
jgi:hypothetical protein